MSNNYQQQVFNDYVLKRDKQMLSLNLMQPTRSGLREECLHVYAEKGSPKDDRVLRLFFGPIDGRNDYVQRIRNFDVDKFRPLVKFLKGETADTKDKNIELLAWLIDFQSQGSPERDTDDVSVNNSVTPEPGGNGENFNAVKRGEESFKKVISTSTNNNKVFAQGGGFVFSNKYNMVSMAFIAAVFFLFGWFDFSKGATNVYIGQGTNINIFPVNGKFDDAAIIASDTFKLTHLKKITRPDTITRNCLGKVWCRKIKRDSVVFYTEGKNSPLIIEKD
jgi:hypothetical protein